MGKLYTLEIVKTYHYSFLCLLLVLLLSSGFVSSQEVRFSHTFHNVNSENGLKSSEVYKVGQDSKGYIWICTDGGVTKYDGFYSKTYTVEDGLVDNVVFDFYEDPLGRIWFLSYNSMLCYLDGEKIVSYKYNDLIRKEIGSSTISEKALHIDDQHNLYYSMRYFGLLKFSPEGQVEQLQKDTNTVELNFLGERCIASFLFDRINAPHRLVKNVKHIRDKKLVFELDLNRIWACTGKLNGLRRNYLLIQDKIYDTYTDEVIYAGKGILRHGVTEDGVFWISTTDGLLLGHLNDREQFVLDSKYLDGNSVTDFYVDDEGGYWISTLNNGIYYTSSFDVEMADLNDGLMNRNIVDVTDHNGEVWVSFVQGWQNLKTGERFSPKSSSYSKLMSIGKQIVISNRRNREVKLLRDEIHVPYSSDFYYYGGNVYMSSSAIVKFDQNELRMDTIYSCLHDHSARRQNIFTSVLATPDGKVYVGSQSGIYSIESDKALQFYPDSLISSNISVTELDYHPKWGLVVATSHMGVYVFDSGKLVHVFNEDNGLKSNKVRSVVFDSKGTLIVGTNAGLDIINKEEGIVKHIGRNQGLKSSEITALELNHEYLYIGTKNGLFRIRVSNLYKENQKGVDRLLIKSVHVDNKHRKVSDNYLELPQGIQTLRVRFRTMNYMNWFDKKYQYRVSSQDEWIDISSPEILVSHPEGELQIEVRYKDNNGIWSKGFSLLNTRTLMPFYMKWYFWLLSSMGISILIVLWYRKRQQKVEAILRMENEMLSLEQRMQNARLNPHFVFNVLNSIKSSLILKRPEIAEDYLNKFSGLMRDVLKSAGENKISIEQEIDIITKYIELEQVRYNGAFDFEINASEEVKKLSIPSMIVQPFVENAIIHGVSHNIHIRGKIIIEFSKFDENVIDINITDNGEQSFNDENPLLKNNTANAIAITRSRLRNYNKLLHTDVYGLKMERNDSDTPTTIVNIRVPGLS